MCDEDWDAEIDGTSNPQVTQTVHQTQVWTNSTRAQPNDQQWDSWSNKAPRGRGSPVKSDSNSSLNWRSNNSDGQTRRGFGGGSGNSRLGSQSRGDGGGMNGESSGDSIVLCIQKSQVGRIIGTGSCFKSKLVNSRSYPFR